MPTVRQAVAERGLLWQLGYWGLWVTSLVSMVVLGVSVVVEIINLNLWPLPLPFPLRPVILWSGWILFGSFGLRYLIVRKL
jgi:hypothetical protein